MVSDKEILTAFDSGLSSTNINTQTNLGSPKILLEDEVLTTNKTYSPTANLNETMFNLESVFTKEFLSNIKVEDLDKPLKEIILASANIGLQWEHYSEPKEYVTKITFTDKLELSSFITDSFEYVDSIYRLSDPNSIEVYVKEDNKENIQVINNMYNSLKKKIEPDLKLEACVIDIPVTYSGDLVEKFEINKEYVLKIPVAKIGKWKHPVYKEVSFTSEDLDNILQNFSSGELGFEPPLYLGHSSGDGTPSVGYLIKLERSGDILFGYWKVNKEVYRLVEDDVYRYSSAEIIRDFTSRKTGKSVGTAVFGMALTNLPFVPDLPKTQALSNAMINSDVLYLSFSNKKTTLSKDNNSNTNSQTNKEMSTETNSLELALKEQVETYSQKLKEQLEQYSQKEAEYRETSQKLSTVVEQNKQLADKIEEYEKNIREKEVEAKLTKLEALSLPVEFKQVYSNLIKEGKLGEVEPIILSSLESLAQEYVSPIVQQSGATEATQDLNNSDYQDPYQAEIERCKKLIAQKLH